MNLPIGTLVNAAAVLVGAAVGLGFRKVLSEKLKEVSFQAIGLFTLFLGIKMAMPISNLLVMVFSLMMGGIIGTYFDLDARINKSAERLKKKVGAKGLFTEGLVTAFVLFCLGSMTLLGALDEGLRADRDLIYTKSLLDGFSAIFLAATFGIGVAFSIVPLLVFQLSITLLAQYLAPYLSEYYISELSAVGGILILAIGLNLLGLTKVKVSNYLPALVLCPVLIWIIASFN